MHWKIKRDYYYKDLYPVLGKAGIEEAGFFEDTATEDYAIKESISVLCTPISPISERISKSKNPCVLLTTGSFCPIHQGHIEMMFAAREGVEEAGYDVLGGYISPGHDEYINLKVKEQAIPIHHRLQMIQDLIERNNAADWLMPDAWEGVFNVVAVNFTDVVYRLEMYLEGLYGQKIPVFFVCGGDNARFALTFLQKGYCVVVGRPSYDGRFEEYKKRLADCSNIVWTEGNNTLSSTALRAKKRFHAPPPKDLYLRIEEEDAREKTLIPLLEPYFKKINSAYISEQQAIYKKISPVDTISLDAYINGSYNLALSRVYDLLGSYKLGYSHRPGSEVLAEQVRRIPKGNYCLFDDDIHTGNTMKYAEQYLQEDGKKVLAIIAMNLYQKKNIQESEVLDCRDFLVGGAYSGLVLKVKDVLVRAPYIYPYVCPFARASIEEPMLFSIAVWKMNLAYYQENEQKLGDLLVHSQQLYKFMGFKAEDSLAKVCEWHLDYLSQFVART